MISLPMHSVDKAISQSVTIGFRQRAVIFIIGFAGHRALCFGTGFLNTVGSFGTNLITAGIGAFFALLVFGNCAAEASSGRRIAPEFAVFVKVIESGAGICFGLIIGFAATVFFCGFYKSGRN